MQAGDGKTAEVASTATEHDLPSLAPQRSSVLGRSSDFHHGLLAVGARKSESTVAQREGRHHHSLPSTAERGLWTS